MKPLAEVKERWLWLNCNQKKQQKKQEEATALLEKVKSNQSFDDLITKLNAKVTEKGLNRFAADVPTSIISSCIQTGETSR